MKALFLTIANLVVSVHAGTKSKTVRVEHQIRQVEGWNVHVDKNLLAVEHKETGDLALRITATLMSQRGDIKGALQLMAEAEERDPDTEGRIASLRKSIEELRDKSNASTKSRAVESDGLSPATPSPPNP